MNVFELRRRVIDDYGAYVRSFISIRDERLRQAVDDELKAGLLWPEARIGLNPAFAEGAGSTTSCLRACSTRSARGSSGSSPRRTTPGGPCACTATRWTRSRPRAL